MPPLLHRQAEAGGLRWPHRPLRAPLRQAQERGPGLLTPALSNEQRTALLAAKLRALVTDHEGPLALEPTPFATGSAARAGERGWFLADEAPARALGPALAWAVRNDVSDLAVLAEADTGVLARRATAFEPAPVVLTVAGRSLEPAVAEPVDDPVGVPPPTAEEFILLMQDVGIDVVVEHGEVSGEVLGLEIARVVVDDDGGTALRVGVGRNDRDAFTMLHGDLPPRDALAMVIDALRRHRRVDRPDHPLHRLAPERWLRARLVAEPGLVGCADLAPVVPVLRRDSVKDVVAAGAVGHDRDGRPVVVAASVGIDLDLVPTAAELRMVHAPGARLLLAVPERDAHSVTRAVAERLAEPADLVTVPADWRTGAPA